MIFLFNLEHKKLGADPQYLTFKDYEVPSFIEIIVCFWRHLLFGGIAEFSKRSRFSDSFSRSFK
jgi:hypothetical protein